MKNSYFLSKSILAFVRILIAQSFFAQQTGTFDRTVNFGGNPAWPLSYSVPASYNSTQKYKLIIGLHGLGDTPQHYRDVSVAPVITNPSSPVYNAIVVIPYAGGDVNTDYWYPVSDTGIISLAIADAMSAYNIDPEYIYLNGFSLGGRSALRYGLLNYKRFRGLELWTPAIQSVNEANNLTSFNYVWQNAKYIPVCMSVGSSDGFSQTVPIAYQHLSDAGGIVNLQIIYGMGHQSPPVVYKFACFDYLNTKATSYASNDAGVSAIATPFDEECSTIFTPVVTIQNKGVNNLTTAIINYQIDNGPINTYNWSGNLIQLDVSKVILSPQSVSLGTHTFKVYTSMPNSVADTVTTNDEMTQPFNSITKGTTTLSEGFEGTTFPPFGWRLSGTDIAWSWVKNSGTTSGGYGLSSSCIYFDNVVPDNTGKSYSIRTAQYDLTNSSSPILTYDYAYAPFKYQGIVFADTLSVYYSTDCGTTWTMLLKKGGSTLSTTGGYDSSIFVPTSTQWKSEVINLSSLLGQPKVMFSFENKSGWGNLLFLDNINLSGITGISNMKEGPLSFDVYPNPNNGQFTIYVNTENKVKEDFVIEIKNMLGQIIYSEKLNQFSGNYSKQVDVKYFGNGLYFVNFKTQNDQAVKKVIVY